MHSGGGAVVAIALLVGQPAPNDTDIPSDAEAMVEHAAIVEEMIDACGGTRPDLLGSLRQAHAAWWQRNKSVSATMQKLLNTREAAPRSKELLAHYAAVYHRLETEVQDSGNAGQKCEWMLNEMAHGRLDYPEPRIGHVRPKGY
jgi:hypothetical protein